MADNNLQNIARQLVAETKGLLAADESTKTISKRFTEVGLTSTPELNQKYRELFFTTSGIEEFLSGVIMFDETVRQDDGRLIKILQDKGIIPGIKVDQGLEEVGGETITKGLEGLGERLQEYKGMGLKFTKWRAAFKITDMYPSKENWEENFSRMTAFAKISQDNGFVPIVEPEVLMDGMHTTTRCEEITRDGLRVLFEKLRKGGVDLTATILKVNMVMPGRENLARAEPFEVANVTLRTLKTSVLEDLAGVVFLSGGQTPEQASANLNEINKLGKGYPWPLSFSFARALQSEALKVWEGKDENVKSAQEVFYKRAKLVSAARQGIYESGMERV